MLGSVLETESPDAGGETALPRLLRSGPFGNGANRSISGTAFSSFQPANEAR